MERIAAVIVTYNRLALLQQCAAAVLAQQGARCDLLLVDNASTDGTRAWAAALAQRQPSVQYRRMEQNLGGAGGFHFGMRWAVQAGYTHVWLMDDDCLPRPDALAQLLAAETALGGPEQYGFLSSAVLWKDGRECKMNRQKVKKSYYEHIELLDRGILQIEQATFVSLLVPAAVVCRAGLPIRQFFIWGDDIEYTRRLSVRLGLPCYLAGGSRVVHAMASNEGSSIAADLPERIDRYRYAFRNEAYLYRQEGLPGICYYLAKCGLNLWRILRHARDHRAKRCLALLGGMARGLVFRPQVEYCSPGGAASPGPAAE